jgi:hypothetical protein
MHLWIRKRSKNAQKRRTLIHGRRRALVVGQAFYDLFSWLPPTGVGIPLAFWCLGMKFHRLAADSLDQLSLSNKMLRLLDKKRPSHGLC